MIVEAGKMVSQQGGHGAIKILGTGRGLGGSGACPGQPQRGHQGSRPPFGLAPWLKGFAVLKQQDDSTRPFSPLDR
ncbi:hypothetical protein VTN00DRAFT_7062 [Thermoascus crustaceus]|uniref:uncharacterized protein n=1 Tax=Thermoascus crustaceus TaxID=5088 RepID=UPI003742E0A0